MGGMEDKRLLLLAAFLSHSLESGNIYRIANGYRFWYAKRHKEMPLEAFSDGALVIKMKYYHPLHDASKMVEEIPPQFLIGVYVTKP